MASHALRFDFERMDVFAVSFDVIAVVDAWVVGLPAIDGPGPGASVGQGQGHGHGGAWALRATGS